MYAGHLSPRIALLVVLGCSILGSSIGYLIGSQGDIIFAIDTRIIGVVAGAVIGSLIPRAPALGTFAHAAAAGVGVAATTSTLLASGRAAPQVIAALILAASIGSGCMNMIITRVTRT